MTVATGINDAVALKEINVVNLLWWMTLETVRTVLYILLAYLHIFYIFGSIGTYAITKG